MAVAPHGMIYSIGSYFVQNVLKINARKVIFSILMLKNVLFFKELKQTTFSGYQITKYLKFVWI